MKTISAALAQHLAGEVTTLATLWKVKRHDGQVFGFTDHDRDLHYDDGAGDGPITYLARSGYTRTAIQSTADLAVDNLDVETFFDAAGITEQDLRAGRWDHAEVRLMLVNWADLAQGHLALRRGFLGEVTITDGSFTCELRGLTQALQQTIREVYTLGRAEPCPGRGCRDQPEAGIEQPPRPCRARAMSAGELAVAGMDVTLATLSRQSACHRRGCARRWASRDN